MKTFQKIKEKKLNFAWKPTIIERINFPHHAEIYIKRDDYTGLISSGNKIRKLEYILFDAKEKGADTLITCGGIQSNHARTTSYIGRKNGFDVYLILRGEKKEIFQGNLLLDNLVGAKIKYVNYKEYKERINEIMEELKKELEKENKKPYIIPEGASNEIGCLGYVECMEEMKEFIKNEKIEAIYLAVGSGGTYAGLLIGKKIFNLDVRIIGIIVCDTIEYFKDKIEKICKNAINKYNLEIEIDKEEIELKDDYIGEGYAIPYKEEIDLIKKLGKYGIILDPVYTGKAFYGMLNESKEFKKILFLHTGGIFSIFAYEKDLS
jgi:D-cysteine desulfhydrase